MKYYLIVGEASGDLHASHLMAALKEEDPEAEFRFFGGDLMAAVGGTMVKHYPCASTFADHFCQHEEMQGGHRGVVARCGHSGGLSGL